MTTDVIIVAAGSGSRFGSPLPKQFCILGGRPVLMHTIDAFRRWNPDTSITIVLSADMESYWSELCSKYDFISPRVVHGGATRHASVKAALDAQRISEEQTIVLIHDGARPLVEAGTIDAVIARLNCGDCQGVVPAIPVSDSLRRVDESSQTEAVDRAGFYAVQTPQAFFLRDLLTAYQIPYSPSMTDDASVIEVAGGRIAIAPGSARNIKITHPTDIVIASALMATND